MNRALYALAVGNFAVATSAFTTAGLLNLLAEDLGISVSAAGQLMTVYALAYALGSPFLMVASGRRTRRWVVQFALILSAAGALLSALSESVLMLYAARIFLAFGAALYTPTAALIALTTGEPSRRIRGLSLVISGLTMAQILGVPLGTYVGGALGWRWGVGLGAPVAAAAVLMVARWVPAEIPFHPPSFASFAGALRDWRLCTVLALGLIVSSGQNVVAVYLAPLIAHYMGAGTRLLSIMLFVFGAAGMVGSIGGGILADRLGPAKTLGVALALNALAALLLPLLGVSYAVAILIIVVWSIGAFAINPPQQARVVAYAPAASGAALSLNAAGVYTGIAVGASLGGGLAAWQGMPALAPASCIILLLGIAFLSLSQRVLARPARGE